MEKTDVALCCEMIGSFGACGLVSLQICLTSGRREKGTYRADDRKAEPSRAGLPENDVAPSSAAPRREGPAPMPWSFRSALSRAGGKPSHERVCVEVGGLRRDQMEIGPKTSGVIASKVAAQAFRGDLP